MQNSKSMEEFDGNDSLQIVRVQLGKLDHWVIIFTIMEKLNCILQQRPGVETQRLLQDASNVN